MTKPNTTYRPLGDYIRPVDVRNKDLKVTTLVGLTIEKCFIPSVANIIGTDLSNYKVIKHGQFACSLMQVSRDGKIPVAMFTEEEAIMSPAYPMFEIASDNLLPEYLMMWFSRPEFDREASYYAVGGVRGSLTWEDFCAMRIPVPPISEQRAIVADYEAVARRISVAKRTIATLQATAQTLYRKMFVDGIDKENLPEGWRWGTLGEVCEIITGKKDVNESLPSGQYRFFSCSPEAYFSNEYIAKGPAVLVAGNGSYTGRVTYYDKEFDLYQRTYACIPYERFKEIVSFIYCVMKYGFEPKFMGGTRGSSIPYIVRGDIADFMFPYNSKICACFSIQIDKILTSTQLYSKEIEKLTEIQTIILSGMGR